MTQSDALVVIPHSNLRDQVYRRLENLIVQGALTPGQRLTEEELADLLGVSRNPVREALAGLSRAGWVKLRPRHGAHVCEQTAEGAEHFFHVRRLLEIESARLAAAQATPETVAPLETLVKEGRAALQSCDREALLTLNSRFHAEVVKIGGNEFLGEILRMLDKRLRWYFGLVVVVRGPDSWREHADLVEAIAANDVRKAAQMMKVHTEGTWRAYLKHAVHGEK